MWGYTGGAHSSQAKSCPCTVCRLCEISKAVTSDFLQQTRGRTHQSSATRPADFCYKNVFYQSGVAGILFFTGHVTPRGRGPDSIKEATSVIGVRLEAPVQRIMPSEREACPLNGELMEMRSKFRLRIPRVQSKSFTSSWEPLLRAPAPLSWEEFHITCLSCKPHQCQTLDFCPLCTSHPSHGCYVTSVYCTVTHILHLLCHFKLMLCFVLFAHLLDLSHSVCLIVFILLCL